MITDADIQQAINDAPKDQYGQVRIVDLQPSRLFPNRINECIVCLRNSEKYMLSTYGYKYGTYKAICLRY